MERTCRLAAVVRRSARRAALCLSLGSDAVLATCAVYGSAFVLPASGSCWGMLALLLYGARLHRAGRYPQVVVCVTVTALWGLIVAGSAGLIAGWTLLAPRTVGWAGQPPAHAGVAAAALGLGAVLVMGAVLASARLVLAVWHLAPGGAYV